MKKGQRVKIVDHPHYKGRVGYIKFINQSLIFIDLDTFSRDIVVDSRYVKLL